jgi:hypothetical protein
LIDHRIFLIDGQRPESVLSSNIPPGALKGRARRLGMAGARWLTGTRQKYHKFLGRNRLCG